MLFRKEHKQTDKTRERLISSPLCNRQPKALPHGFGTKRSCVFMGA